MTAAQVAEALGYSSGQHADAPQTQDASRPEGINKQPAVRRQVNGKKKRGREAESSRRLTPTASTDAFGQQAVSRQAAEVASRAGSPGVSSSNDACQAETPQEHSSGQSTAEDDEEQKRMVGPLQIAGCLEVGMFNLAQSRRFRDAALWDVPYQIMIAVMTHYVSRTSQSAESVCKFAYLST